MASGPGLHPGLQPLDTVSSTYQNLGARPKISVTLSADAIRTDTPVVSTETAVNTGVIGPFESRAAAHACRRANALHRLSELRAGCSSFLEDRRGSSSKVLDCQANRRCRFGVLAPESFGGD